MGRNPRKLRVFLSADALVPEVYRATARFPDDERYGLRSQIRRAAVSVPANIVDGCARNGTRDYLRFLNIATGSTAETRYLVDLSFRLTFMDCRDRDDLFDRYTDLLNGLQRMLNVLSSHPESRQPL